MARRRGRYLRRRLTRNQKFAGSAVIAGLLLAAGPRPHTGPGRPPRAPRPRSPGAAGQTRRWPTAWPPRPPTAGPASQTTCLDELWTRESNFETGATNPQTGAYGIPQSLPAAKMAAAGADWQTNPATQIRWGLGYIAATYGTPCAAWSHEEAVSWY